jgi:hypothetical protein
LVSGQLLILLPEVVVQLISTLLIIAKYPSYPVKYAKIFVTVYYFVRKYLRKLEELVRLAEALADCQSFIWIQLGELVTLFLNTKAQDLVPLIELG